MPSIDLNRRRMAAAAALLTLPAMPAWAQSYPSRPIRVVVPYPAGGSTDQLARAIQLPMQELLASDNMRKLAEEVSRRYADRIIGMSGGHVVFDGVGSALDDAKLAEIYGGESWLEEAA